MAVKIGSARIDERGKISGGKAGDQTGGEVSTQGWYKHSKGWRTFRAKDPAKAEKIAECMEKACASAKIGYDQNQRNTLYTAIKGKGFDISKLDKKVETDCSALVRVCCAYAGISLPDFNTSTEASALLKSGAFEELTASKYNSQSAFLKRGDIQVTKTKGHTIVVLTNGGKSEPAPKPEGPKVTIVDCITCNLREGPGKAYKPVVTAKKDDTFGKVVTDGWVPVDYNGKVYWVNAKYVKG